MRKSSIRSHAIAWAAAALILVLRWTCRVRVHGDPRETLRRDGVRYIYAVLHAHQVAAILGGERGTGAMVSRSRDGEIIVPSLRIRGIIPVRGSGSRGGNRGRGGKEALEALIRHVVGGRPAYLAVDGPRGPRGKVQRGITTLARRADAVVLCMIPVPRRRWVLRKAWDRLQIPKPFTRIDGYFAEPIRALEAETSEQLRVRIEETLRRLEREHDPIEADIVADGPTRERRLGHDRERSAAEKVSDTFCE